MSTPDGPTDLVGMRERNLALVLAEIDRSQPITRARLAELTGLTKTTVSARVAALTALGLVSAEDPVRAGRGRPGAPVSVASGPIAGLGVEINVGYLSACVLDLTRRVRIRRSIPRAGAGSDPDRDVAALGRLAHAVTGQARRAGLTLVGTTVAVPGVLHGGAVNAPNLGWDTLPAAELIAEALPSQPLPVTVDNEANLAALGELWFGAGAGLGDYVYVSGETGIGAGIVVGGALFRGTHGAAGELGHVVVAPGGPACRCGGRGCLEQVAGLDAVLRAADVPDAAPARPDARDRADLLGAGAAELVRRLEARDRRALAAAKRAGEGLGIALVAVTNLFDPAALVLGGLPARMAPWLTPHITAALEAGGGRLRGRTPTIWRSELTDGAVLGAAGEVVARVLAAPGAVA
ncbi:ROK family protein [Embleya sp. NPDC056575]|uniref:ROK family transcriptional regulator n=1 Tax=unclassified Embleya TaxID=2699296 RepID=UPI00367B901D